MFLSVSYLDTFDSFQKSRFEISKYCDFCFFLVSLERSEILKLRFRSSRQRCSVIKVFLKISQNSQENICARVAAQTPFLQSTSGGLLWTFLSITHEILVCSGLIYILQRLRPKYILKTIKESVAL